MPILRLLFFCLKMVNYRFLKDIIVLRLVLVLALIHHSDDVKLSYDRLGLTSGLQLSLCTRSAVTLSMSHRPPFEQPHNVATLKKIIRDKSIFPILRIVK